MFRKENERIGKEERNKGQGSRRKMRRILCPGSEMKGISKTKGARVIYCAANKVKSGNYLLN